MKTTENKARKQYTSVWHPRIQGHLYVYLNTINTIYHVYFPNSFYQPNTEVHLLWSQWIIFGFFIKKNIQGHTFASVRSALSSWMKV